MRLAAEMNKQGVLSNPLPWVTPALVGPRDELAGALVVAETVSKLEVAFWRGKVRTAAAERTWDRLAYETRRLPAQATLTMDLLVAPESAGLRGGHQPRSPPKPGCQPVVPWS